MQKLRSHDWFYAANELGIQHKGALRSAGINMDGYSGQPIIGIANTWSELNNCNMSLRQIAAEVKKGVYEAGGIPLEFPVMSLGEELMKPSAMLYRNLLSMEVEENIRSYPLDGIVLLGNCDKTVPGLLMGAASANIPAIQLNGGPKKVGVFKGQRLGSGTDLWKYWDDLRMGKITDEEWEQIGKELSCGFGSCNTMGSASSLNGMLEVLGMMPLGLSTLPVESEERYALTREAGKRIVDMVKEDWKPSDIMTINNFRNAIRICMALGGSTNSVIHLTAIAGRLNISLFPDEFEEIGKQVPCITDVQPSGNKLVDELNTAGGIPGVIKQLGSIIDLSAKTYTGKKLEELLNDNPVDQQIIRPVDHPVSHPPTLAVLRGNLAPRGALIKVSAADQNLLIHTGKAVVFEGYPDMLKRIDDPNLRVDPSSVLVLKYAGSKGVPGMPEWGMIPIPKKLKSLGITDMVRVSDSRMSGTSFGTVILHVTPEAALGGAFAVIRNGDFIQINIPKREINLLVDDQTIAERLKEWIAPVSAHVRGYPALYEREILQADEGCDFDILKPKNEEALKFVQPVVGRS